MTVTAKLDQLGDALFEYAPDLLSATRTPGLSVAVSYEGERRAWAFGMADPAAGERMTADHVFQAGSLSKMVVGVLCMREVERGLDLDAPVSDLLPYVRNPFGGPPVTVRHLLSHLSGLNLDAFYGTLTDPPPLSEFVPRMLADGRAYEYAGARPLWAGPAESGYRYSSFAFAVAAHAIEVHSGELYETLAAQLFDELGMSSTHLSRRDPERLLRRAAAGHLRYGRILVPSPHLRSAIWPAASMLSTPSDQVTFLLGVRDAAVLSAGSLAEMTTSAAVEEYPGLDRPAHTGLGFQLKQLGTDREFFGHGASAASGFWLDARAYRRGLVVVTAVNAWDQAAYLNPPQRYAYALAADFVADFLLGDGDGAGGRGMPAGDERTAHTAGMIVAERMRGVMGLPQLPADVISRLTALSSADPGRPITDGEVAAFRDGLARFADAAPERLTPDMVADLVADGPVSGRQLGLEALRAGASSTRPTMPFGPYAGTK